MDDLLRPLAPVVLGALVRRYGSLDSGEDATQEALIAAALQWPSQGVPDHPAAWLIAVGTRRLIDARRSDAARHQREVTVATLTPAPGDPVPDEDDTLTLLLLCCHPALTEAARMALTLRAVGGLTTAEIAAAFLVSEATMGQRISRAKQRLKAVGATFERPVDLGERLQSVLHVLYLIFNEGYTSTRAGLTREAIRLTRELHRLRPADGEVAGLLALMLLTEARRPARTGPDGALVPLAEQDRRRWDAARIAEGCALIARTLVSAELGPYQLQAAIAAVHDEAADAGDTDWAQIVVLYQLLDRAWPNPVVRLNQAVPVAMVRGPAAGLALLATLDDDERIAGGHRLFAVRAHLLEMAGDRDGARAAYEIAGRRTTSPAERRYLEGRATALAAPSALFAGGPGP